MSPRGAKTLLVLGISLAACAPGTSVEPDDAGVVLADLASAGDAASVELGETAVVAHTRELRALWVATVSRLDFPSRTNLTAIEARTEIQTIVDAAANHGMNAIFFQVRPESDAMYDSALEPWSRFASGTQGVAPAYDPLALFVELAHARGVELHAWMNPYRGLVAVGAMTAANHVTKQFPASVINYGGVATMNPADSAVRAHVVDVAVDLTSRYDIDGVVFDDYFYPYPGTTAYPDDASYTAYQLSGGSLGKSDWRRGNVNQLVAAVGAAIHAEKSWVRWGIAPFGIYRPGIPSGVTGLDAYEALSCDSLKWITEGWVDYLAPQLYWTSTSVGQPFGALASWWAAQVPAPRGLYPSLALYRLGETSAWTTSELETQVMLSRGAGSSAGGQTWFRSKFLVEDAHDMAASLDVLYAAPARPPVVPAHAAFVVPPPIAQLVGDQLMLSHPAAIAGYAVYTEAAATWRYVRWVPTAAASAALTSGRWAISAIDHGGAESLATVVTVP